MWFLQFSMTCFPPLPICISEGTHQKFLMQHFFEFEHMWQLKCQTAIVCFVIAIFQWMVGRCINELYLLPSVRLFEKDSCVL